MATVTELLNRLSYYTGLRATGVEQSIGVDALNAGYREILSETRCRVSIDEVEMTTSEDYYGLATLLGSQPLRMVGVDSRTSSDTLAVPMKDAPIGQLVAMRQRENCPGRPAYYAMHDFATIAFFANPAVGDEITFRYVPQPKNLSVDTDDADNETTPSMIPVQFHWDVLFPKVMSDMMGKDARNEQIVFWKDKYEYGASKMKQYVSSLTGQQAHMYQRVQRGNLRDNSAYSRRG